MSYGTWRKTSSRSHESIRFLEGINRALLASGSEYMIPFGKGATVREGDDVAIITYGALVERSKRAAKILAEEHGVETTIIDMRTIQPYDWELIAETVQRIGACTPVLEDLILPQVEDLVEAARDAAKY